MPKLWRPSEVLGERGFSLKHDVGAKMEQSYWIRMAVLSSWCLLIGVHLTAEDGNEMQGALKRGKRESANALQ